MQGRKSAPKSVQQTGPVTFLPGTVANWWAISWLLRRYLSKHIAPDDAKLTPLAGKLLSHNLAKQELQTYIDCSVSKPLSVMKNKFIIFIDEVCFVLFIVPPCKFFLSASLAS